MLIEGDLMKTDIEISQESKLKPIQSIASKLSIPESKVNPYGKYMAKVSSDTPDQDTKKKLILVTAINPTPAGEGKSTVLIGLGDALNQLNKKVAIALREPSMGPVMGMKGGAAGGGFAQVEPMVNINLNFTGDIHALTSANNTLAALIDNSIYQGNKLNLDPRKIQWHRAMDVNDRELRNMVIGLGGSKSGVPREEHFEITAASELMAILCLSTDLNDLKYRIKNILIGYTYENKPVFVSDLGAESALTIILKDAINPNLVQTLEHTPAFIHGGPFANLAMGCNSVQATNTAMKVADYTLTEAGFGSDLGGEKFMDLVSPHLNVDPSVVVVVASIRALKFNGGLAKSELSSPDVDALKKGVKNLDHHIRAMKSFNKPVIVAINQFNDDSREEIQWLNRHLEDLGVEHGISKSFIAGGKGSIDLAQKLIKLVDNDDSLKRVYSNEDNLTDKINKVAKKIYGAGDVALSSKAKGQLKEIQKNGWDKLPICISKTQYSLSDDPKKLGDPSGFTLHITELLPKLGAGYIVAMAGKVITMPGLPKHPAAIGMDIDKNEKITGLF